MNIGLKVNFKVTFADYFLISYHLINISAFLGVNKAKILIANY